MKKLLSLVLQKPVLFIVLSALLTIFFSWQLSKASIDPNTDSLFPKDEQRADYLQDVFGVTEEAQQVLLLGVKDDFTMSVEKIRLFKEVIDEIEGFEEINSSLTPFNFPLFAKNGAALQLTTAGPQAGAPQTTAELETFKKRLTEDDYAYGSVAAENGTVLCALFYNKNISNPDEFMRRFNQAASRLDSVFEEVFFSGEIPFAQRTTEYLLRDLLVLVISAAAVMILIFYLSFRTVRGVILPMAVVVTGSVWSVGLMSLLNWPITIISITVPPLVLAIGSSYAIHILNEYYRSEESLLEAVLHVNKTVLIAALTTTAGFISLMSSSIQPVKQFSAVVIAGIITCAAMSLFLLPSILSIIKAPNQKQIKRVQTGRFSRIMKAAGTVVYRHTVIILIIFAAIFTVFIVSKNSIPYQADYLEYFPSEDPVIQNNKKILEYTGGTQALNITLKAPEGSDKYFLQPEVLAAVSSLETEIDKIVDVQKVTSFTTMLKNANRVMSGTSELPQNRGLVMLLARYMKLISGTGLDAGLVSADYNTMSIFLRVYDGENLKYITETGIRRLNSEIEALVNSYIPSEIESARWGDTVMFLSTSRIMNREQAFSTALSLLMIFIITSVIFKSVKFGIISLVPLFTGIMVYYIAMAVFRIPMDMTTIMVTNIAIGVGVDDSIHFLLQYRKQMEENGRSVEEAVKKTFVIAGRPIVLTTAAIVAGMMIFCFASFKPIVYFGLLVSVSLTAAMIGTLVFVPTVIRIFHKL